MQFSVKLRIAIDCRMLSWGGVGRYTQGLIQGLSQIPTHHKFILICHSKEEVHLEKPNNFEIIETKLPVFSLRHLKAFSRLVNNSKVDVFHSSHFIYPWFYIGKGVATIHDLIPMKYPKTISFINRIKFILMTKYTLKKASNLITVSNNTKKDIVGIFNYDDSRISVIYEAVDDYFYPQPKDIVQKVLSKYRVDKDYFLYVGACKPHKNIIGLVNAYSLLPIEIKEKYSLVLVGKKDRRYLEVDNFIRTNRLTDFVIQLENVSDNELPSIYSGAEIFIFPSYYEGFGLPPLESMACGTPVISSNTSSLPEVLGNNAIFINPDKPDEISSKILGLLSNANLKSELSTKGINHVKTFSWKETAEETLKVYEKIASS